MISRLGGAGVPIVSQSKLRPIFRTNEQHRLALRKVTRNH